ncbi:MAG: hypothetical protein HC836_31710 [Richelia sp. RM2_1_2]|nr:hypothetical protein [Richelia sp. RM2_1_2]
MDTIVNIYGLKCDFCDYEDMSIPFADYPKYINAPCPKCGANLLLQEEYDESVRIYKIVAIINKIKNILKWINPFHYWRLIFGDKRPLMKITKKFPKRVQ